MFRTCFKFQRGSLFGLHNFTMRMYDLSYYKTASISSFKFQIIFIDSPSSANIEFDDLSIRQIHALLHYTG